MRSLILSGWAQPADALQALAPDALTFDYSEYPSPEASFDGLRQFRDAPSVIAWSLGGQLAMRAIAAGVLKPRHLTLLAAPYQFISTSGIKGMDPLTFEQFRANYAQQPARTKTRFHALVAKGDRDAPRVLAQLRHHPEVEQTARWLPWLDALATYRVDDAACAPFPATLLVHGIEDAIVPFAQGGILARNIPGAQLNAWQEVGHAPHMHDAARLRAEIAAHRTQFMAA